MALKARTAGLGEIEDETAWMAQRNAVSAVQADLIRCVFGNPFHPQTEIESALRTWENGLVVSLAKAAYDNRLLPSGLLEADRLMALADAWLDAGCSDPLLLAHLQTPGPHVRGCWVLDQLLGKA